MRNARGFVSQDEKFSEFFCLLVGTVPSFADSREGHAYEAARGIDKPEAGIVGAITATGLKKTS